MFATPTIDKRLISLVYKEIEKISNGIEKWVRIETSQREEKWIAFNIRKDFGPRSQEYGDTIFNPIRLAEIWRSDNILRKIRPSHALKVGGKRVQPPWRRVWQYFLKFLWLCAPTSGKYPTAITTQASRWTASSTAYLHACVRGRPLVSCPQTYRNQWSLFNFSWLWGLTLRSKNMKSILVHHTLISKTVLFLMLFTDWAVTWYLPDLL